MKRKAIHFVDAIKSILGMILGTFEDPFYQGVAEQIAFSLFLSILPILILLSQFLGIFSLSLNEIRDWVDQNVAVENAGPLLEMFEYSPSGINGLFMAIIAIWAASRLHFALLRVTNYTHSDGETIGNGFVKDRIKSIQNMIMTVFTLAFALIVLVYGELIIRAVFGAVVGEDISAAAWVLLRWPIALGMYFLMISSIYYMLPSEKVPYRDVLPGSVFAAIGFWVVTYVYTFYVTQSFNYDILYGSFSNMVAMMIWFWFLAWVICIGVVLNRAWWATRRKNNIPIPEHRRKNINRF